MVMKYDYLLSLRGVPNLVPDCCGIYSTGYIEEGAINHAFRRRGNFSLLIQIRMASIHPILPRVLSVRKVSDRCYHPLLVLLTCERGA